MQIMESFKAHEDCVCSMKFTLDGTTLVSATQQEDEQEEDQVGLLSVWTNRKLLYSQTDPVCNGWFALSPDDATVAWGTMNGSVRLLRLQGLEVFAELNGHRTHVTRMSYRNSRILATAGTEGTVRIWDLVTLAPLAVLNTGAVRALGVAGGSGYLATAGNDPQVNIWDFSSLALSYSIIAPVGHFDIMACNREETVAVGSVGGTIVVCDLSLRSCRHTLDGEAGRPLSISFSEVDGFLFAGYESGQLVAWDTVSGQIRRRVSVGHPITAIATHPTCKVVTCGDSRGVIHLVDCGS